MIGVVIELGFPPVSRPRPKNIGLSAPKGPGRGPVPAQRARPIKAPIPGELQTSNGGAGTRLAQLEIRPTTPETRPRRVNMSGKLKY